MTQDLRCYTVHLFFQVMGADIYDGGTGYVEIKLEHCTNVEALADETQYAQFAETARLSLAEQLRVDPQNVTLISCDEFKAITDDAADAPELADDDDQLAWLAGDAHD